MWDASELRVESSWFSRGWAAKSCKQFVKQRETSSYLHLGTRSFVTRLHPTLTSYCLQLPTSEPLDDIFHAIFFRVLSKFVIIKRIPDILTYVPSWIQTLQIRRTNVFSAKRYCLWKFIRVLRHSGSCVWVCFRFPSNTSPRQNRCEILRRCSPNQERLTLKLELLTEQTFWIFKQRKIIFKRLYAVLLWLVIELTS